MGPELGKLVEHVVTSDHADTRTQHTDRVYLPSPAEITELVRDPLERLSSSFIGRQRLTRHNVAFHVGDLLPRINEAVSRQIQMCLCYVDEVAHPGRANP